MSPFRTCSLALLLAIPAAALDPARAISQYDKRNWRVEDGLPHTYVMSISPGLDGYIWIGTDEGLARFDGLTFRTEDVDPSLHLSKRWILRMIRARDGGLWIGTYDGWIYRVRDRRVEARFNAGASVFALLEDGAGTLWASTRNGLARLAGNRLDYLHGFKRPPDTAWETLALDANGAIWIVTIDGLYRHRGDAGTLVAASDEAHGAVLSVFSFGSDVFAGTSKGLFRIDEARRPATVAWGGMTAPVVTMLRDRQHNLWVGTWGDGLHRLSASGVEKWTSREGLPDDFVRTLYEDSAGSLWIGTRTGGLSRWKDTPLVTYGIPEGLTGSFASTVVPAPNKDVWLGTWRAGMYRFRSGEFEPQLSPLPALFLTVRALALDRHGRPWIGNWEGLNGLVGSGYRHFGETDSPYLHVSAIAFDRSGRLWLGTSENGVFLFSDGTPSSSYRSYLPGVAVTSLQEDERGVIWAGTNSGVRFYNPNAEAEEFAPVPVANTEDITAISADTKGRIWAATMSGQICLVAPGRGCLGSRHGLPSRPVYRVVDDGRGSLWLSSPRGVLQVSVAAAESVLDGRAARVEYAWYGQHDGMRSIECHRLSQPSGGLAADGSVWFATTQGFVRIFPDRVAPSPPPRVVVEGLSVDGRATEFLPEVVMSAGTHAIEVHFTALEFASPEKVRFRYRMEGFDPDWVDAGEDRTVRYSGLPPGVYRLSIAARAGAGAWSEAATAGAFRQLPRFYQTGWFMLLTIAVAGALIAAFVRWRLHVARGRYALVLAERNRISGEWHDTLLAGFAAISWQLEEALSRMQSLPDALRDPIALALKMLAHYRAEARRVIWDLRDGGLETATLPEAVRLSLEKLVSGTSIQTEVAVRGSETRIAAEYERNILRICQEAATNAKRHGNPNRIDVRLDFAPDKLTVTIKDDGRGFDKRSRAGLESGHFGLAVMEERAQRIGGRLRVESQPGNGALVEAEVPIPHIRPSDASPGDPGLRWTRTQHPRL